MKFVFIYAPAILAIILLVMLFFYKLDELYPQIVAELLAREGKSAEASDAVK